MGLVKGIGEINNTVSQAIHKPFNRHAWELFASLTKRGRVIFSNIHETLFKFCKRRSTNQCGNLKEASFLGSQGDRFPKAICIANNKQPDPNGPVNPGGIGNKKGKTSNPITKLNPRSEVSAITSAKVRGWFANRSSSNLISWENLRCIGY